MKLDLSPELRVVLACCCWPARPDKLALVCRQATGPIDWNEVARLAERHRVEALVYEALIAARCDVPAEVAATLRDRRARTARTSLLVAAETLKIADAFQAAGIRAVFLKGACLEVLAYGALGTKSSRDVDVWVDRGDLEKAGHVLRSAGWVRTAPPESLPEHALGPFYDLAKDAAFAHAKTPIVIELHHRLSMHMGAEADVERQLLDSVQFVELRPGRRVPTLAPSETFAYLSLHGAAHEWVRIKWLADLAALLCHFTDAELVAAHGRAVQAGLGRHAAQALILCESLLDTPIPASLSAELRSNRQAHRMARSSQRAMASDRIPEGLADRIRGLMLSMRLARGWRETLEVVGSCALSKADIELLRLPKRLFFLYYVLRIPMFAVRKATSRP